jgi:hypothetical protein
MHAMSTERRLAPVEPSLLGWRFNPRRGSGAFGARAAEQAPLYGGAAGPVTRPALVEPSLLGCRFEPSLLGSGIAVRAA